MLAKKLSMTLELGGVPRYFITHTVPNTDGTSNGTKKCRGTVPCTKVSRYYPPLSICKYCNRKQDFVCDYLIIVMNKTSNCLKQCSGLGSGPPNFIFSDSVSVQVQQILFLKVQFRFNFDKF